MAPVIEADLAREVAGIALQLTGWTGATGTFPGITRIDHAGVGLVRTQPGQAPVGGTMIVVDYECALRGPVRYEVRWGGLYAKCDIDADGLSVRPVISLAHYPRQRFVPEVVKTFGWTRAGTSTIHPRPKRCFPMVSLGPLGSRQLTMQVRCATLGQARELERVLETPNTALLRQPTHDGLDAYFVPLSTTLSQNGEYPGFLLDITVEEVERPSGDVVGALGWDIDAVVGLYATITQARSAYASIADLAIGPLT